MKKINPSIIRQRAPAILLFAFIICLMPIAKVSSAVERTDTDQMNLMDQEIKYEKEKSDYLQSSILDKILGPGRAVVIIDIELGIETQITKQTANEQKNEKKKRLGDMEYLLPGIPNPKSVTNEAPPAESKDEAGHAEKTTISAKTVIKKQVVTVLHDEQIPQEKLDTVKDAISSILKITPARGDRVDFKKTKFTRGFFEKALDPYILIPSVVALLILFFLFGPLSSFFRSLVKTLREKGGTEVTVDSTFAGGPEGEEGEGKDGKGGGVGGLGGLESLEGEEKKYIPFKYITEENLKRLLYIIRKESPEVIALVISYLKPEYVRLMLNGLSPELQAQVAVEMATIRQMTQQKVLSVDNDIKDKIDFLVGGLDHLLKVLDEVDIVTKENILDYLKNEKPELYERVKKYVIVFEDIPSFPDLAMQTIIRELKSESLAKALRDAPADIMNKFFANMSVNAAAVLKEEMEYGRPLTKEEIEEERKKIIDTVKQLERDTKIFIRERPKSGALEGIQDIIPGYVEPGTSGDFNEYFNAGAGFYDSGDYQNAVGYFEYCSQLDPMNAQVFQYLGNCYYSLGRNQEALAAFERALEINPADESLRQWLAEQKKVLSS
ncbi:MAG: tetratricopeptide repeat protein [Elusimicrobia bacterium]|nr:tetratricopeptide repeat protein [Candidatus Liberimonas magnetica]